MQAHERTDDRGTGAGQLEREHRELRRANEMLKTAPVCSARELDPRLPK